MIVLLVADPPGSNFTFRYNLIQSSLLVAMFVWVFVCVCQCGKSTSRWTEGFCFKGVLLILACYHQKFFNLMNFFKTPDFKTS